MTDASEPPKRRRRGIVVVAAFVLAVAWWLWPRGLDQRFVGKWGLWFVIDKAAAIAKEPNLTASDFEKYPSLAALLEDALYGTLELRADGTVFGNASKVPEPLSSLPTWLRMRLLEQRMKLTGQLVFGHSDFYEIETVETDRIRFTAGPDGYYELRRTAVDLRPTVPSE